MKNINIMYLLEVIIAAIIIVIAYFILTMPADLECELNNDNCISEATRLREACTPSTSIITVGNSTNYLKMRISVFWDGNKCVTSEEVIEDMNSGTAPYDITGYNNTCNLTVEELEKYGIHACQGSLFDFVIPASSGGSDGDGGFAGGSPASEPPHYYCGENDDACKNTASNNAFNCISSEIEAIEVIEYGGMGMVYWSIYMEIDRGSDNCHIYYKVINAINLPPEIPPQIVGTDMDCYIDLNKFPISGLQSEWCSGSFVDYFILVYQWV